MTWPSTENFARSEIGLAYTLLWGACLHGNEERRILALRHARDAYRGAVRFGADHVSLETALHDLGEAVANWSHDRAATYRNKSIEWAPLPEQTSGPVT